jgi:hypothetical protein
LVKAFFAISIFRRDYAALPDVHGACNEEKHALQKGSSMVRFAETVPGTSSNP